ncbi:MAG: tetratricopeptide repeat protein [Syntrophobacteraceae bacterium]
MTRAHRFHVAVGLAAILLVASGSPWAHARPGSGQTAPSFALKDLQGKTHDIASLKARPMTVLYFFDAESKPSQEGLVSLAQVAGRFKDSDLTIWAVTLSPQEKAAEFAGSSGLSLPVLLDKGSVSELYDAQAVLPTVCIIGPDLKVLDFVQGGGKSTEIILVRVAERELQRKETRIAMAIGEEVAKKDPENLDAKTVEGHAALRTGLVDKAIQIFQDLTGKGDRGEVLGKEGLAAAYARKGDGAKAMTLASEVEQKAPGRKVPNVVKGDVLAAQNKTAEAQAEYQKAVSKQEAAPYEQAKAQNQLGRLYAKNGDNEGARKLFDEAVAIDPFYIEGTTNKGLTYERQGQWDKALESYRQTLSLEKSDVYATALARNAQQMVDAQKDVKQKERIDKLVKELAERYRSQKGAAGKNQDSWTSRPMVLTFLDMQEKGGLPERDGLASVLALQLSDLLNGSNRVKVVERVMLERLIDELNLGSSQLADPETALKLGRVLAAKLIGTGSLVYMPGSTLLSMRFIDTETTTVPLVVNRDIGSQGSLERDLSQLYHEILKTIVAKYPLRGYVAKLQGDRIVLNIGSKQGVVPGAKFDVVQEGEAVEYKGKKLHSSAKPVGQLEVVQVEPDLCYAQVLTKDRPVKVDDKVQEKLETP